MKSLISVTVALLLSILVSCSKNDNDSFDPEGTVTLNMMNEENGNIYLGASDVYIDRAGNFVGNDAWMTCYGHVNGLSDLNYPLLDNPVRQAAVEVGGGYAVYADEALHEFPSGTVALASGSTYYRMRVVSLLYAEAEQSQQNKKDVVGAVVRYCPSRVDGYGLLPAVDELQYDVDGVMAVEDGALFDQASEIEPVFGVECKKEVNGEWFIVTYDMSYGQIGYIYLRFRDSWTRIEVRAL